MLTKVKKLIGTLIGFTLGLFVSSILLITFFLGYPFATNFDKVIIIMVFLIVVDVYSFFGNHSTVTIDYLKKGERN